MKVRFLCDGESPDFGTFKKGDVKDLKPEAERLLIARGVAELSSTSYKSKKSEVKKANG